MYEMKQEYLTGITLIDEEHAKLFDIAEEAHQLLHNPMIPDKFDQIKEIMNGLKEYTKKHFADEEAYMESTGYKRLFTQKIQHQAFIEKLEEFDLDTIDEDQEKAIGDILEFLTDWLVHHILENDKKIGEAR